MTRRHSESVRYASPSAILSRPLQDALRRPVWLVQIIKLLGVAIVGGFAALAGSNTWAADTDLAMTTSSDETFNTRLLPGTHAQSIDISRFERGNPVVPGTYRLDVFVNNNWVGRTDVAFRSPASDGNAAACFNRELLVRANVDLSRSSAEVIARLMDPSMCVTLRSLVPDARVAYDSGDQRLDITIPQAAQTHTARGYVNPEFWDKGVNAATLNYAFNTYDTDTLGVSRRQSYLGLDAGLNVGDWHFRHSSSLNWQSGGIPSQTQREWQNIATYVQRDLPGLDALLTLGDSYTSGDIFDSIRVRGVQLASEDRMLPDSLRGYAPVVRGVADTNAKVTVRQNGIVIYEATVSPGPFEIKDLYSIGYGGDLNVTVTEADGRVRTFSVPYASVAQLLRPNTTRFSVAAGELNNQALQNRPHFVQATVQHGFTNVVTGYGGIVGFDGYSSALIGAAVNTRVGAIAIDFSASHTVTPGSESLTGESVRLSYSKLVPDTNTNLTVAAYRYSTNGYLSLTDAAQIRDEVRRGLPMTTDRERSRFSISLTQPLGMRGGSMYLTGSTQSYWNGVGADTQFQLGYNNTYGRINYNFSVTRTKDVVTGSYGNQFYAGLTMPFGDSGRAINFTSSVTRDDTGHAVGQGMLSGAAGADNQFSYGVTATRNTGSDVNSGSVNGEYRGPYARLSASYANGTGYTQNSLGAAGSVVVHPGGVTFGQTLGETIGIVEAPDAAGAQITDAIGAYIDGRGYAVVPYLTPYSSNTVGLSPKGLPLDVQLDSTSLEIAPYAGAVVMMRFKTSNKRTAIIHTHTPDGMPLPFGAQVIDANGLSVGVVSQSGRIFARLDHDEGRLSVSWGSDESAGACTVDYHLPLRKKITSDRMYDRIDVACLPRLQSQVPAGSPDDRPIPP